jgi:CubicO group peptidase (beta-lactamase class C family)
MASQVNSLTELFKAALEQDIGSGIAASYGYFNSAPTDLYAGKTSHLADAGLITSNTRFDLASLTKILATTSLYMVWVDAGLVDVDAPIEIYLPEEAKAHPLLAKLTIRQLLSHTSGLSAWKPFYEDMKSHFGLNLPYVSLEARYQRFFEDVFSFDPETGPGVQAVYSDLGFLILGYMAEKLGKKRFDHLVQEQVWSKIPGCELHFRPVMMDAEGERYRIRITGESVAMTEECPWRGLLQGQVHDDGAWSMGGICGHAGVFGTLNDVKFWMQALVNGKICSYATLEAFSKEVILNNGTGSRRTMGFDMPALNGTGTTAFALSPTSIGHLGFTGTSLWMDLDRGFGAILLTNRVHPSRLDLRIRNLRREFHTQIG